MLTVDLKPIIPFINGGLASMIAESFTFPIDLVKTRLQLQGQKHDIQNSKLKYRGFIHGIRTVFKEEGITALYSGVKPALLRQATYGTLKMGFYQSLKKTFLKDNKNNQVLFLNVFFGMISGAVANGIANPTDVLKVRLQAKNNSRQTMTKAFIEISKQEGLKGLYRGIVPNMQRAAIITGVELPVYDSVKSLFVQKFNMDAKKFSTHFSASLIAGLAATLAATPVDVIKTRLMSQKITSDSKASDIRIYKGLIDCLVHTVRHEGIFALYKGLIPSYIRLGPWNILFFVSYEQLKKLSD